MNELLEKTFVAERDHFWFKGFRRFVAPLVEQALAGVDAPLVLDCGCGTGTNMALMSSRAQVFGFDLTRLGLDYARAQGGQRVAHASITHIPFRSGAFDLATSFDVLVCLNDEQEARALGELARIVRPGGCIVLNVAALEMLRASHSALAQEVRRYTRTDLRRSLAAAGLQVERLTYTNFSIFPLMVASRTWQKLRGVNRPAELLREISVPPAPVNSVLSAVLSVEARALRSMDMPIGSSILCLARKPQSR